MTITITTSRPPPTPTMSTDMGMVTTHPTRVPS
jgi:hypothetical protein